MARMKIILKKGALYRAVYDSTSLNVIGMTDVALEAERECAFYGNEVENVFTGGTLPSFRRYKYPTPHPILKLVSGLKGISIKSIEWKVCAENEFVVIE